MNKKALIIGITGQDGAFLAQYLLENNYVVYGTSRDKDRANMNSLKTLNIENEVIIYSMSTIDFRSVVQVFLEIKPDEIYNLSGQSSVGLSFEMPFDTHESISIGTLNILEVIRLFKPDSKFYNASSSECFGDTGGTRANEKTLSDLKVLMGAKSSAFWQVSNYREAYDLHVSSGILFNHESFLRPKRFVTQKIVLTAIDIYEKKQKFLKVGNVDISRDWGWAPDYVKAMHLILQQNKPDDYIIASGKTISLRDFIKITFEYFSLNYEDYLIVDKNLFRPSDILISKADNSKAAEVLGWKPSKDIHNIIKEMIEYQLNKK